MAFHQYSPLFTSGLLSDSHPQNDDRLRSFLFLESGESDKNHAQRSITSSRPPARHMSSLPLPSRDNQRHLPCPKPAPSSNLPDVPGSYSNGRDSKIHRPRSELSSPGSPPPSDSLFRPQPMRSASVKSEVKRHNRSAALARLEGRSKQVGLTRKRQNFMNMDDDDDEEEEDDCDSPHHFPTNTTRGSRASSVITMHSPSDTSRDRARRRNRAIESWFPPLTNFIDLKEDDGPAWRSFIEITKAS